MVYVLLYRNGSYTPTECLSRFARTMLRSSCKASFDNFVLTWIYRKWSLVDTIAIPEEEIKSVRASTGPLGP